MITPRQRSHKTGLRGRAAGLGALLGAILLVGCAGGSGEKKLAGGDDLAALGPDAAAARPGGTSFAEQWMATEQARAGQIAWPPEPAAASALSGATGESGERGSLATGGSFWTIVLGTFTGENHRQAAQTMVGNLPAVAPQVSGAQVHTSEKGSMVILGRFASPDDDAAQAELSRIRAITYRQRPVFRRAILSRVTVGGQMHPHDLRAARLRFPRVDPLYTLQVAAWSDFESGQLTMQQIRTAAEAYAGQLRTQGHEAYFHHDDTKRVSIVTVGLFGRDAIDPATGLLSPDVEILLRRFPHHLVNGEKLEMAIDPRNPKRGRMAQQPSLVAVPK